MKCDQTRIRIFATHPVQYHVPLWRELARYPQLDLKVFYFNDQSVRGGLDKGFGVNVRWDVDLLGGYDHQFLTRDAPLDQPATMRISDPVALLRAEAPDWVLIPGYTHAFERQIILHAKRCGSRILMRGEFSDLSFASRHRIKEVARYVYLRSFYSRVDRFCYIGEGARQHLSRHGVPSHRMFFSPYSVDDELIKQQIHAGSRDEARAKLGLQGDTFSFLLSGKLIDRKNPFAILEALRMVRSPRETALIVLGDGELKEPFVAKGRELLGDRLIFAGFVNQSQLGSYYAAADALVMPSQYETWGLVVNEAMHYGVPVIVSSQVGCAPDLVEQGRTGYVYRHGDIGQLAAFMQLLVDDPEAARIKGRAARERVARYVVRESTAGIVRALGLEASKPGFTERTAACAQQA